MNPETDTQEKPEVHHGHNMKFARNISGLSQEQLAELLGSTQKAIYRLEQQKVIEENTLIQIANVLHFPIEFFKQAQPDHMLGKYSIENNTQTIGDNSVDSLNLNGAMNGSSNNTFTIAGDAKCIQICEKFVTYLSNDLKESKRINKNLEAELARVQKELERLKSDR